MRKISLLFCFCIASCGGGSSDSPSTVENDVVEEIPVVDPFIGEWESGCISSQLFGGNDNALFLFWGVESIQISETNLLRKWTVYEDSSCSILIQSFGEFSNEIESRSEFVSDDGYTAVKFNLMGNEIEDSVSLSFVDGILYRVSFDIPHFESTGEIKNNVIFEVKYDRVQ